MVMRLSVLEICCCSLMWSLVFLMVVGMVFRCVLIRLVFLFGRILILGILW